MKREIHLVVVDISLFFVCLFFFGGGGGGGDGVFVLNLV